MCVFSPCVFLCNIYNYLCPLIYIIRTFICKNIFLLIYIYLTYLLFIYLSITPVSKLHDPCQNNTSCICIQSYRPIMLPSVEPADPARFMNKCSLAISQCYLHIYISIYLLILNLSNYLSIYISIYLYLYLFICLSI